MLLVTALTFDITVQAILVEYVHLAARNLSDVIRHLEIVQRIKITKPSLGIPRKIVPTNINEKYFCPRAKEVSIYLDGVPTVIQVH